MKESKNRAPKEGKNRALALLKLITDLKVCFYRAK